MKKGLGRGLSSLIPKERTSRALISSPKENVFEIEIDKISSNPYQPREDFDEETLKELSSSIREYGIIQPLIVTKKSDNQYELLAGERRFLAAKLLKMRKVPVIVRSTSDQEKFEISLIENLQRKDLNTIEEAKAFERLSSEFNLTQHDISKRIGKSRSYVANILRLLTLPEEIQNALRENKISFGHAKAILGLKDEKEQMKLFKKITLGQLSVRQAEEGVRKIKVRSYKRRRVQQKNAEILELEEKLQEALKTRVVINKKRKGGKIIIEFYSSEELQNICHLITE